MKDKYWAHGECGECGFIGDLWFVDEDGVIVGVCPTCSCTTPLADMPEFPSDKVSAKK